jgi:hypothetical protein
VAATGRPCWRSLWRACNYAIHGEPGGGPKPFGGPKPCNKRGETASLAEVAVAMGISGRVGGDPGLTAVLVILTGILGAILVTPLLNVLLISGKRARGFAAGLAAHGPHARSRSIRWRALSLVSRWA